MLALIVGVGGGGAAGFLIAPQAAPGFVAATPAAGADWVDVVPRVHDDSRSVPVTARLAEEWKASAPSGGVVRRTDCEPGAAVSSGDAPFVIDDRPVVFLALKTPVWRDMWPGARGVDIAALQKELRKLGHKDVPTDGYFGTATSAAVRKLWEGAGGDPKQNWVPLAQVVWMEARKVVPSECPLKIGQQIGAGDALFTVGGGLVELEAQVPADAVQGGRVAVFGEDQTAPLDADGAIGDQGFLAAYSKGLLFQDFLLDKSKKITVETRLAEPVEVVAVPASSLYGLADGHGCVVDESGPVRVEVVASQLGETYVRSQPLPSRVVASPDKGGEPCG